MLLKIITRNIFKRPVRMFAKKRSKDQGNQQVDKIPQSKEYFYIPVQKPIFPHMGLLSIMNKHLQRYLGSKGIRNLVAIPIKNWSQIKQSHPQNYKAFLDQFKIQQSQNQFGSQLVQISSGDIEAILSGHFAFDKSFRQKNQNHPIYYCGKNNLHQIGTLCRVKFYHFEQSYNPIVLIQAQDERVSMIKENEQVQFNPLKARFKTVQFQNTLMSSQYVQKYKAILQIYEKIKQKIKTTSGQIKQFASIKNLELLSGYISSTLSVTNQQAYKLFSQAVLINRFTMCLSHFKKFEKHLNSDWQKFQKQYQNLKDSQVEKQKMKHIYQYLKQMFNSGNSLQFVDKIKRQLKQLTLPEQVAQLVQYQLRQLSQMHQTMPDAIRKKHFIQTLLSYPWGKITHDTYDLAKAKKILDQQHYGMDDLKKRILQFIAITQRQGTLKQKVILLDGPPGVGKTSISKSIAKCLNRSFARISLGGQYDVNIIKGHRKTYVGAYPGKIYQSIKNCKSQNPVILLDEIDKINVGPRGNLMQAIMQILDPAQNHKFKDEFLDISINLSKVLFICTSNDMGYISQPLRDRMEIMHVPGYSTQQKIQIFKNFVAKKSAQQAGLSQLFTFQIDAIKQLINGHCRQSGVRSLQQTTNNLFYRIAYNKISQEEYPRHIQTKHLQDLVGLPKYSSDRLFQKETPVGVMIGMAYNSLGGTILYIQSIKVSSNQKGQGQLIITGKIANVMKQSCMIAHTYVRHLLSLQNNNFLQNNNVHLNFPDIQIGKDGPSAGVAIASTLISLAQNKSMVKPTAMTGQINLSGQVRPIGGLKQKILAAKRQNIKKVIVPQDNRKDILKIGDTILQDVQVKYANRFQKVYQQLFNQPLTI